MKPSIQLLLLSILLISSCSKTLNDNDNQPVKNIDRVLICIAKPFFSKTDSIYIGLNYFKNYTSKDKVTLTLNGKILSETNFEITELTGTKYLYKSPALNSLNNAKVIVTIDDGKKITTNERFIKFIENYQLETVWDNLDNASITASFPLMTNPKSINFGPSQNTGFGFVYGIGSFIENPAPNSFATFLTLIPAINGFYIVNYDDSKKLQNLTILNGDVDVDPTINYNQLINNMKTVYGQIISSTVDNNNSKITKFLTARLQILVYERKIQGTYRGITTVITLK
jgi:hypothetical protein